MFNYIYTCNEEDPVMISIIMIKSVPYVIYIHTNYLSSYFYFEYYVIDVLLWTIKKN